MRRGVETQRTADDKSSGEEVRPKRIEELAAESIRGCRGRYCEDDEDRNSQNLVTIQVIFLSADYADFADKNKTRIPVKICVNLRNLRIEGFFLRFVLMPF